MSTVYVIKVWICFKSVRNYASKMGSQSCRSWQMEANLGCCPFIPQEHLDFARGAASLPNSYMLWNS